MALPTVNLFEALEAVPGGRFNGDPATESLVANLNTIINNITNQVNEQGDTLNSVTLGLGKLAGWQVVTQSDYGSGGVGDPATASTQLVAGAVCLLVTFDRQLIVGTWHNAGGGTNNYVIQLLKAVSPYSVWTNLAGDSKTPTTITWTSAAPMNNGNPCLVQDSAGDLHVGYYDSNTAAPKEAQYTFDGANWTLSTTRTLATTFIFNSVNEGQMLLAADGNLLWARRDTRAGPSGSVHIYRLTGGSWGTDPIATYTSYYDPTVPGCLSLGVSVGEDCRIVQIDEDHVVAFWMWQGNTTDGRYTLLWTMSTDGGATWPQSACAGTNYAIGYPGTATGSLFPLTGGAPPVPTANLRISGSGGKVFGRFWDVAHIPGTSRIAIAVWGDDAPGAAHGQLPGIRYLEFDASGNSGLGSVTAVASWATVNVQVPVVGLMLSVADGVIRLLWGQGIETTLNDGAIALCYARVVDGGDPLDSQDWTAPREVFRFANQDSSVVQYNQFTAPVTGVFTTPGGEKVWPLFFARGSLGAQNIGAAAEQALLSLLRVADLDRV